MENNSDSLINFLVNSHADQIDKMREKMNQFNESLQGVKYSIEELKKTLVSVNSLTEKLQHEMVIKQKDTDERIKVFENRENVKKTFFEVLSKKIWPVFSTVLIIILLIFNHEDFQYYFSLLHHKV